MKLIHRYLLGSFFRIFSLAAAAFLAIFLLVTVFESLRTVLKYDASFGNTLLFLVAQTPWMLTQAAPLAALLGSLVTLTLMARNGELTALRAAGMPLRRIAAPLAMGGLLIMVGTFWLQETVVPPASRLAREIRDVRIKKRAGQTLLRVQDVWLRSGRAMVRVDRVLPEEKRMTGITVFERDGAAVRRRLRAEEAVWNGAGWELHNVRTIVFPDSGPWQESSLATLAYPLAPRLEEITVSQGKSEEWNMATLGKRIKSHRAQGLSVTNLEVDLWAKTSIPFTCFLLPLLAVPFSIRSSRRTGLWGGVAAGILIGLVYILVVLFGISLGRTGTMPPWLAAWAGNIVFLVLTIYLFRRAEWGK